MWPILFDWQGMIIYTYPLFIGLSWGLGYRLAEQSLPDDIPHRSFGLWMLGLFLSSWMGAKALFVFTQDRWATAELVTASNFWLGGGFVFLGGFLGGGFYTFVIGRIFPTLRSGRMSFVLVPLLWAHALGRVGCFLAGCCFGTESHLPWAVALHGIHRHPTQLYEACGLALLAWALQKKVTTPQLIPHYLVGYGVLRWIVELFRGDELRGFWLGQSTSQWIALLLILGGLGFYAYNSSKSLSRN